MREYNRRLHTPPVESPTNYQVSVRRDHLRSNFPQLDLSKWTESAAVLAVTLELLNEHKPKGDEGGNVHQSFSLWIKYWGYQWIRESQLADARYYARWGPGLSFRSQVVTRTRVLHLRHQPRRSGTLQQLGRLPRAISGLQQLRRPPQATRSRRLSSNLMWFPNSRGLFSTCR
jgi:hypothetical protein